MKKAAARSAVGFFGSLPRTRTRTRSRSRRCPGGRNREVRRYVGAGNNFAIRVRL